MKVWEGRVFSRDGFGGNATGLVDADVPAAERQSLAMRLGYPDTAFVVSREVDASGRPRVMLRTHSPVEEITLCIQTSLAAPVALGARAGEIWQVDHAGGSLNIRVDEGPVVWASLLEPAGQLPPLELIGLPRRLADRLGAATGTVVRTARPRLYVLDLAPRQLEQLYIAPDEVLALCADLRINGLVIAAWQAHDELRVRVFTTSLSGREDAATGGAVLEAGRLLRDMGAPETVHVTQGSGDDRGYLRLRIPPIPDPVEVGSEVHETQPEPAADSAPAVSTDRSRSASSDSSKNHARGLVWLNRVVQAISSLAVGGFLIQTVRGVDIPTCVMLLVGLSVLVSVGTQLLVMRASSSTQEPESSA